MTLKELSQLYHLKREIEMDTRRLRELEMKAEPGSQNLTGTPRAGGITDKVSTYAVAIADLRDIIADKQRKCIQERERLERYIAGIEDSQLRRIFTYRFAEGLSWSRVAAHVGGRNTAATVRQAARRYIKNNGE